MTKLNSASTITVENTTPAAQVAAAMPEAVEVKFEAPTVMKRKYTEMTARELVEALADGTLKMPSCQREFQWTEQQIEKLIDSILRGYVLPPLTVAVVTAEGKETLRIVIDGCQRSGSIERILAQAEEEGDAEVLKFLENTEVSIMELNCAPCDVPELFTRYNNGSPLSGLQRARASLPEAVLESIRPYIAWAQSFGIPKFGKVTCDVAAMMIAAAVVNPAKASSNGSSAAKVLASAEGAVAYDKVVFNMMADALSTLPDETLSYWLSPARLVPLSMVCHDEKFPLTAEGLVTILTTFNPLDPVTRGCKVRGKGANPVIVYSTSTISTAFGATANSAAATEVRYWMLYDVVAKACGVKCLPKTVSKKAVKTGETMTEAEVIAAMDAAKGATA